LEVILSTREKIIDAAFELFSIKGYLGTTTKEIAQLANISEVTVFRHFGTKENIFEAVMQSKSFLTNLKNLIPKVNSMNLNDALLEIALEYMNTLISKKGAIKIFFSEVDRYPEKVRKSHNAMVEEMDRVLTKFLMSKLTSYSQEDIELITKMFLNVIFGFFLENQIIKNEVLDFNRLRKIFARKIDFLLNGIL